MKFDTDVVVVGAGPVGATTALLLAKAGLRCTLIERRERPLGHPAGHVINPRSLEIWRQIDPALASKILNASAPIEDLRYIIWCTSLAGDELARINTVPNDPQELAQRLSLSPMRHAHYPQNRLEQTLWQQLEEKSDVTFLKGQRVTDVENTASGVAVKVDGDSARTLTARYCIAADGARSPIRESLGIDMPGPMLMRVASLHFTANLDRLIRTRPAVIYWIYNEHMVGPLIRHIDNEWILMSVLHPPPGS